jgi:hypothetical protein
MLPSLFFSYSHIDESLRDQLEKHLSGLKRQGLIEAWHDRRISAGKNIGEAIDSNLDVANVILLLISPDFIASDYCYEREMSRAMEKHKAGTAQVIPIILRPCDWHDLPFGNLSAAPRDGKAITLWPNIDEAFLDVVKAIKTSLKDLEPNERKNVSKPAHASNQSPKSPAESVLAEPRSSNLRVKKQFSDLDRDRFRQSCFDYIARYFENSMHELVERNPNAGLAQRFQRIDIHHFTAAVYQNGDKVCKGALSISNGMMGGNAIQFVLDDNPRDGGMNEAVFVKSDDQILYLEPLGMQSYGRDKEKLTDQGAAEFFWELFIRPLQ